MSIEWSGIKFPAVNLPVIGPSRCATKPDAHKFYQNVDCKYFPCHPREPGEKLNCLFCYCPMYFIQCPGHYRILDDGRKDCMDCSLPHDPGGWEIVQKVMQNPKPFVLRKADQKAVSDE